jgi:predicted nucleic-acid-binding protein
MAALDTNVLVRYLVQDDPAQADRVEQLIDAALAAGETLYVPVTVALELEWVLRSNFKFSKTQVIFAFSRMLAAIELSLQSEAALEAALAQYRNGTADFADCVHVALARVAGEQPLWTFDRAAAKAAGARLLA